MPKFNSANERIKRTYIHFLREAKGRDNATIDSVVASLARFENFTGWKDFKLFRSDHAVAFKQMLAKQVNATTGQRLSHSAVDTNLRNLKAFFEWLALHKGYRAALRYSDAEYFRLSGKETAVARARREKKVPTIEQVNLVLKAMPAASIQDKRNRALVACAALTGARANALVSFQLRHVDLDEGYVDQDARQVRTKFSKTFRTYFMPACDGALEIFGDWIAELQNENDWRPQDPLFPKLMTGIDDHGRFELQGLDREFWKTTEPVRYIFRRAFAAAGLPYFNPHSFRDMLVRYAMSQGVGPEEMKAWSQNLGHNDVLTTFTSYGALPSHQQARLVRQASAKRVPSQLNKDELLDAIAALLKERS